MALYGSRFKLKLRTICCIKFLAYKLSTRAKEPGPAAAGFARFFLRLAHVKIELYNCLFKWELLQNLDLSVK